MSHPETSAATPSPLLTHAASCALPTPWATFTLHAFIEAQLARAGDAPQLPRGQGDDAAERERQQALVLEHEKPGQRWNGLGRQETEGRARACDEKLARLRAVVGPSYGGWQALQWALAYPDMVDAAGVIVSGLTHPAGLSAQDQRDKLAQSPEWHGGNYHAHGGMTETLFDIRMQTMRNYGLERLYEDRESDATKRQAMLEKPCRDWASRFDPYSLVVLAGAAEAVDVRARLHELRARFLLMVCTTDAIFPPSPETTALMDTLPVPHRYVEIDSPYGHMASGVEWRKLEPELRWLLDVSATAS